MDVAAHVCGWRLANQVFSEGDLEGFEEIIANSYVNHNMQHNPLIADRVSGLGGAIQSGVWAAVVERAHRILADGAVRVHPGRGSAPRQANRVLRQFRVERGKLAEHRDVVFPKPATLRHQNGLF